MAIGSGKYMTQKKTIIKEYEPFENCKGLIKVIDKDNGGWYDAIPEGNFSYAYQVAGFSNVFIIYDYNFDEVIWFQKESDSFPMVKSKHQLDIKKGVRVWESMHPNNHKLFLFNIDWFLGK